MMGSKLTKPVSAAKKGIVSVQVLRTLDVTHRTAAATVILFLERLRNGKDLAPIAVPESL